MSRISAQDYFIVISCILCFAAGHISFYAWMVIGAVALVANSVVRYYYWIRSGFKIKEFEATYFGHGNNNRLRNLNYV